MRVIAILQQLPESPVLDPADFWQPDVQDEATGLAHETPAVSVGRVNSNTAPVELGAIPRWPPWDSMMEWLIDSPIPMPFPFVLKNGSKMRFASPGSIPGPES